MMAAGSGAVATVPRAQLRGARRAGALSERNAMRVVRVSATSAAASSAEEPEAAADFTTSRRGLVGGSMSAALAATYTAAPGAALAASAPSRWYQVSLPIEDGVILLDLSFVPESNRGFFARHPPDFAAD